MPRNKKKKKSDKSQLVPKSEPNGKVYIVHNPYEDDKDCEVCTHHKRDMIEHSFISGFPIGDIVATFGLDVEWLKAHCRGQLNFERIDNTYAHYGEIINRWHATKEYQEITTDHMLSAAKQLDNIAGRSRPEGTQQAQTIQFVMSAPAGAGEGIKSVEQLEDGDEVIELLPSAVEKEEELAGEE